MVAVPAVEVAVDRGLDGHFEARLELPQGEAIILPLDPISGSSLTMSDVQLERLRPAEGAQMVLACGASGVSDSLFVLRVQQADPMVLRLSYQDSSTLRMSFDEWQGIPGYNLIEEPTQLRCYTAGGRSQTITLQHEEGLFALGAKIVDSVVMRGRGVQVAQPNFFRPEEGKAVSSLLGGEIAVQEPGKVPLEIITLRTGQRIVLDTTAQFFMESIVVEQDEIQLRLSGSVESLRVGTTGIEWRLPSVWQWWWHNRKEGLIGGLILLLGLIIFVPNGIYQRLMRVKGIVR